MADIDLSDYKDMSVRLRAAAPKVRAGMRKQLRDLAKPIALEVVREGSAPLPKRGGLSANLMSARTTVGITTGGMSLSLGGRSHRKGEGQMRQINDAGVVRHPVFGRHRRVGRMRRGRLGSATVVTTAGGWKKSPWVAQKVPSETYTNAFIDRKERVQKALGDEVGKILKELS